MAIIKRRILSAFLRNISKKGRKRRKILDISCTNEYESLTIHKISEHTRAYIKIQDGCNQFCSYCIIPYTRGRIRSKQPEDVIREIRALAREGCERGGPHRYSSEFLRYGFSGGKQNRSACSNRKCTENRWH